MSLTLVALLRLLVKQSELTRVQKQDAYALLDDLDAIHAFGTTAAQLEASHQFEGRYVETSYPKWDYERRHEIAPARWICVHCGKSEGDHE